ncbi:hypothetical protein [Mesorhizobium sp. AA23]|uniref:antitoxin Xre/MbcA/ParS-like domain-containing protein n=1 Tax=Mesorhizobium sp. AA23 TaxID=1854058 RepID=UPI0007FECA38|nr:hypothetical protein [Mesorhizobium sp. AA23]OBQ95059.1 hypothetical protein A9K66_06745 [Mesorhizobium sp. AA23]
MTRFQNPPEGTSQDALAGLVAEAVRQALMQHGVLMDAEALICATAMAGGVAAALPFQAQRLAITSFKGSWTGLASEFFRAMAEKIARAEPRDAGSRDENPKIGAGKPIPRPFAERVSELQSMLIEDWAGEVAGSTYLEEKFRIPRSTLHRWQRRAEVVALRKGGRKHVFPLAQFIDGRPARGISEVLAAITNPRLAWFWLAHPCPELDGRVPIEMLRERSAR